MDNGNLDGWNKFLDKKLLIVYDDGGDHPKKKIGWIVEVGRTHLILRIGSEDEGLNLQRIIRVEVFKE